MVTQKLVRKEGVISVFLSIRAFYQTESSHYLDVFHRKGLFACATCSELPLLVAALKIQIRIHIIRMPGSDPYYVPSPDRYPPDPSRLGVCQKLQDRDQNIQILYSIMIVKTKESGKDNNSILGLCTVITKCRKETMQ